MQSFLWSAPYFLGFDFFVLPLKDQLPDHCFIFNGPTGNLRRNDKGELLGDGIYCFYPKGDWFKGRSVDFRMTELNYRAPPE
jgi:hypothetical protein